MLLRKISSPVAKPVVDATVIEVPVGLAVTVVRMPSAFVDLFDPIILVLIFLDAEIVAEPSAPVPLSIPPSPPSSFLHR
jgi:hypothetical protein